MFNNTLLIWVQHEAAFEAGRVPEPFPTLVAGYRQWQGLGRQVMKGQPGYMIFAPVTGRFASSSPADPNSWRRLGLREKHKVNEVVRSRMVGARPAYVWDASQTDGEPLPVPPAPTLLEGEAPSGLWEGLAGQIRGAGFEVLRVPHEGMISGANGMTDYEARTVAVRENMDPAAQVKTLAHELAHVLMHDPDDEEARQHRGIREVEAESAALMVGAAHGMDTAGPRTRHPQSANLPLTFGGGGSAAWCPSAGRAGVVMPEPFDVLAALIRVDRSTSLAFAARTLAAAGVPVFPCVVEGKRPLTRRGFLEASSDPGQVAGWWSSTPNANIGIPTGVASGVVDVDVDVRGTHDGRAAFEHATDAGLVDGAGLLVRTPTGGAHVYFPATPGREQRSWQAATPGVDFRGDGGYIIAPPSRRIIDGSVRRYEVADIAAHSVGTVDAARLRDFPRPAPRRSTTCQQRPDGRGF